MKVFDILLLQGLKALFLLTKCVNSCSIILMLMLSNVFYDIRRVFFTIIHIFKLLLLFLILDFKGSSVLVVQMIVKPPIALVSFFGQMYFPEVLRSKMVLLLQASNLSIMPLPMVPLKLHGSNILVKSMSFFWHNQHFGGITSVSHISWPIPFSVEEDNT